MKRHQVHTATLQPHHEEIGRALRARADAKNPNPELSYQADIVVKRLVTKLANIAGVRRLIGHSTTFIRAVEEINRRGREGFLPRDNRMIEATISGLARWLDIAHVIPKPAPKALPPLPPLVRHKALRRVRIGGDWLEEYGIERDDRALIAMTGDVRHGELAYFKIKHRYGSHNTLAFAYECDETCHERDGLGRGLCLRTWLDRCTAHHSERGAYSGGAEAFGRIVAVERNRKPVETTLNLRPYDEREGGPTTYFQNDKCPAEQFISAPPPEIAAAEMKRRIGELHERIAELDKHDEYADCNSSRRFQLLKEIYDFEQASVSPVGDEWPEYIGEGEAA